MFVVICQKNEKIKKENMKIKGVKICLKKKKIKEENIIELITLKAKFWYSEDVNKNPVYLFLLLQLNISLIN